MNVSYFSQFWLKEEKNDPVVLMGLSLWYVLQCEIFVCAVPFQVAT